jgi:signal transduction histidine kinase/DNA-binding response OmpR family regulator/HAMP domain-containing protein
LFFAKQSILKTIMVNIPTSFAGTRLSFFRSLRGQLILLFLAVSLIPLITVGWLAYTYAQDALKAEVINKLIAVRDIKVNRIAEYFEERLSDLKILSKNPFTINAIKDFEAAIHADMGTLDIDETGVMNTHYRPQYLGKPDKLQGEEDNAYNSAHAKYHPILKAYKEAYGYYDIFLVEQHTGNILYTVEKEEDFGTSLLNGPYANTNLGRIFQTVIKAPSHDFASMEDFAYYGPSKEAALFIASPIFDDSQIIGVLIFQIPTTQINAIMQERTGLGQTGETILIGSQDFLLRSDSRFFPDSTLLKQKVDTEATRASAVGITGVKEILDYRGEPTLIAHIPLDLPGVRWSLNAKMDKVEAFARIQSLLNWILIIIGIGTIIVIGIAIYFSNSIAKPVHKMTHIARQLAEGNMNMTVEVDNQNEIGLMAQAFRQMITNVRLVIEDIVQLSQGLAAGNLRVTPNTEYQGDFIQIKQALETALSDLRFVIKDIDHVSQELAEGHWEVKPNIKYQGDFIQIKNALLSTASKLAKATVKNTEQNWLKTGQTQLNDRLSGEQDILQLSENAINFMTSYVEAQIGAIYLVEEESQSLKMVASHAYTWRNMTDNEFRLGESIVGQAALERKPLIIVDPPAGYIVVQSGLGKATPKSILVMPFLYENTLKGVIELASFQVLTEIQIEFLHQIMPSLATFIHSAQSRHQMQALLEQTQKQSEELQSQTRELEEQQAALQQTNEELQSQSEELQAQQEELRYFNEELEDRTHELEAQKNEIREKNQVLQQHQKVIEAKAYELERASQYKSEFLANMSHELRTPLNSLLILAQLLSENKDGTLNKKQIEYARTIHSAGSDLLALINDILDLSKVEAGKMELNIEPVSLTEFVEVIEQKFRHLAEDKGLAFDITLSDNVPLALHTDEKRLNQIINNLLSNAFKFTLEGKIQLDIQTVSNGLPPLPLGEGRGEGLITFSVIDTGIGISNEKQEVIFEAFQQADGTTSRSYGGTGLGLSISRQLARLLGGELQLNSEENQGSTFTLYLPETFPYDNQPEQLSSSISETTELSLNKESQKTVETNGKKTLFQEIIDDRNALTSEDKSLLIIEDDRQFSHLVIELARENGFKCLLGEDGKTGLQLAEQYQPTAIILDIGLPQLDGWSVMDRLKNNTKTRHIPVHFMSAYDQNREAKRKGAIGYLHKPVSVEELNRAFNSIQQFISKTLKHILVIADQQDRQQKILDIVEDDHIKSALITGCEAAYESFSSLQFDCIILDVECGSGAGVEFLVQFQQQPEVAQIPIIVYADRDLTAQEEKILQQYEDRLTIKAVNSPEGLLDEVTLFLHQVEANLAPDKRSTLRMIHDKTTILKHKKLLIVDDDMRNVFSLASMLEDHDMEIVIANNGNEALAKLEEHQDIALVLMDIMMPEKDGYETMREIRTQSRYHQLPIIALTAKAMKGDKAKCIEAGANDYLSKPVNTEKLLSLIRIWLYR